MSWQEELSLLLQIEKDLKYRVFEKLQLEHLLPVQSEIQRRIKAVMEREKR